MAAEALEYLLSSAAELRLYIDERDIFCFTKG